MKKDNPGIITKLVGKIVLGELALGYGLNEAIDILSSSIFDFISLSGLGLFLIFVIGIRLLTIGLAGIFNLNALADKHCEETLVEVDDQMLSNKKNVNKKFNVIQKAKLLAKLKNRKKWRQFLSALKRKRRLKKKAVTKITSKKSAVKKVKGIAKKIAKMTKQSKSSAAKLAKKPKKAIVAKSNAKNAKKIQKINKMLDKQIKSAEKNFVKNKKLSHKAFTVDAGKASAKAQHKQEIKAQKPPKTSKPSAASKMGK